MTSLLTDDDILIEDEDKNLKEIATFYKKLFQSTRDTPKVLNAQQELLQFTTRVMDKKKVDIEQVPIKDKISKILQDLPKGKAPGLDGLTTEAIQAI